MVGQPEAGELKSLILVALEPAGSTTAGLAQRLTQPPASIEAAVSQLVQGGLAEEAGGSVTLTKTGRLVAVHVRGSWPANRVIGDPVPAIDLSEVVRFIGSRWPAGAERAAAEEQARDELLASDAVRDSAVDALSEAYAQGRLSSNELEQRTGLALSARSYGELDDVLHGLGGLPRPVRSHPVRKAVFWGVAIITSPFLLISTLLFAFGSDVGDHVGGFVFLVLLLPGLFALRRWAWPRPSP